MTFREGGGGFEGGRVRRGGRGGAIAGGGIGLGAIAAFLIFQFTGVDLSGPLSGLDSSGGAPPQSQADTYIEDCTVEEANERRDCRLSASIQALDAYWIDELRDAGELPLPEVTSFEGGISTGCGSATSAVGPFYCPADQGIYMDLGFFDLLESRFGASGGPLAEIYVTAHEYGHHIQNVTGVFDRADRSRSGAESDAVRTELQADCYAGMAIGALATTVDPDRGVTFMEPITEQELADALSAAAAVGDDHIQEQSGGDIDPHTWTHGSSEQRQRWFTTGYEQGSLRACDTFAAAQL